jgi:hypothetical protein
MFPVEQENTLGKFDSCETILCALISMSLIQESYVELLCYSAENATAEEWGLYKFSNSFIHANSATPGLSFNQVLGLW